mgnify:CR=1 FL=1
MIFQYQETLSLSVQTQIVKNQSDINDLISIGETEFIVLSVQRLIHTMLHEDILFGITLDIPDPPMPS